MRTHEHGNNVRPFCFQRYNGKSRTFSVAETTNESGGWKFNLHLPSTLIFFSTDAVERLPKTLPKFSQHKKKCFVHQCATSSCVINQCLSGMPLPPFTGVAWADDLTGGLFTTSSLVLGVTQKVVNVAFAFFAKKQLSTSSLTT